MYGKRKQQVVNQLTNSQTCDQESRQSQDQHAGQRTEQAKHDYINGGPEISFVKTNTFPVNMVLTKICTSILPPNIKKS